MALIESKFVADNAQRILRSLEKREQTTAELSNDLNITYSSARKALGYLLDQGLVTTKPGQLRNAKWSINKHITSNQIIPIIKALQGEFKLDEIMGEHRNTRPNAAVAAVNLPRHITRIFAHAKRLAAGQTTTVGLDLIRADVERDAQYLRQAADIYEQILRYPRIWDADLLAKFPEDIDFDEALYEQAYSHYFKEDTDEQS